MDKRSLVVILVGFGLCRGQSSCPDGFEQHGDRCYQAVNVEASWIDAKMYCRVLGADLAAIESQAEETLVEKMLSKLYANTNHNTADEGYWLDGSDIISEGEWRWMGADGGSRVISGYTNWQPGQPDNNRNGVSEQCMNVLHDFNMHWNDYPCHMQQRFICESGLNNGQAILG